MIIVRISGGVGNQLFQYAMGRALSLDGGQELKLDTSFYEMGIEKDRYFMLPIYSIPDLKIADDADFQSIGVPNPKRKDIFSRMFRKIYVDYGHLMPLRARKMIVERTFKFLPEILKIRHSCYLSGVWQTEKYFIHHAETIRKELALSVPLSEEAVRLKQDMASGNSISLHVRRGDQVHDPHLLKKHGALGEDYYKQAVNYIVDSLLVSPCLYIFSDEIDWCKENLKFNIPTVYVEGKKLKDYEEMVLMSLCAHNIIAKSSFSWWGAWLNRNPNKIVIAPKQRFGSDMKMAPDLYPESWIKI